ncbi:MAG: hypothetical protein ABR549_06370 [Mycobacteriales bacterium]
MLTFVVIGLVTGSIYSIAALGLVVTYRTSGIFDFGHGAIATAAAYVFYELHVIRGLPWPLVLVLTVFGFGTLAGLAMERLARVIAGALTASKIVATLGVLLIVQGLATWHYGSGSRDFPQFLPVNSFALAGVRIGADQVVVVVVALVTTIGLFLFFSKTTTGQAMRAVVDDPALLDLTGVSPGRVRRTAWVIGCCFASVSGILIAPTIGLDAGLLTLLVVQAFAAAAFGLFRNLPTTYLGGLAVGVVQALTVHYVTGVSGLTSLPPSVPFLLLFIVLLLVPRRRLVETGRTERRSQRSRVKVSPALSRVGLVLAAAALLLVPAVVGARLPVYTAALAGVVLFLSVGLLVRTSGQLSLCQVGFQAIGASTFAHAATGAGLPWGLAVVLAALAAVPVGILIAVPAIRLAPLFLALATFGFGILLVQVVYTSRFMFNTSGSLRAPRPAGFSSDTSYYYLVLAVVGVAAVAVLLLERARIGRLLRALSESPTMLVSSGANTNVTRVLVFAVSAFLAGLSGALLAPVSGYVNGVSFPYFNSLLLLAVLAISGPGLLRSAFVASAALTVIPFYIDNRTFVEILPVLFGLSAIATVVLGELGGRVRGSERSRLSRTRPTRLAARPASVGSA